MTSKDMIKKLQKAMNTQGEDLVEDGDIGPKTQAALAKYDVTFLLTKLPEPTPTTSGSHDLGPALKMIKEFEGYFPKAYLDPVGIPTIGWGTIKYPNGVKVKLGESVTVEQATEYLMFELQGFINSIDKLVKVPITNNQFCALLSFTYNLGAGALGSSGLLKKLNAGADKTTVGNEFLKWDHAGGKVLAGLTRRRKAERALFLS